MLFDYTLADNTLAFVFNGPMDRNTIEELRRQILKKLEVHEVINLYLEDQGVHYFTLYSVIVGIIFPLQHNDRFDKVAMVTDRSWIHLLSDLNANFLKARVRNFTTEERLEGMSWVTSYT